ncbi:hypothetical protein [Erythrobacter crassostreae]|uniref:Uncharacterized protein n=1 Tax=Erythrobacter crassostreae TaxID=2828328 RepID=A0A9X1F3B9_9SPHN|nr:hypothetical protein [Erythrobacter crassostrea]MBV7258718.1 hypothetical protein [Erythrobacter crassostrea]
MNIERLDWFIALPLLASLVMIAEADAPREAVVALTPWAKGLILGGLGLLFNVAVAAASAIDRRCSEEYAFQIMANAALVGFAATMLVNLCWVIGEKVFGLPELASDNIIGILTFGWAISYYWFRFKGVAR